MRVLPACCDALLCVLVSLLFIVSLCYSEDKTVEVVGIGECADCALNNIETSKAFSGLHVTIDCKGTNGFFRTRGAGELDGEGNFKALLPAEMVKDGELKEQCYAQLHSASSAPCPAHNGLDSSKIVFKSNINGKHTFGPSGNLKFAPVTCTSLFLWPHFKYPPLPTLPPLPKPDLHPWHHKHLPKVYLPPFKSFGHPFFHPKYKPHPAPYLHKPKDIPPPAPIYKEPIHPPVPVYNPPSPKVSPPPTPIHKEPIPPPVPVYNPPSPMVSPPPPVKKPCPPSVPKATPPPAPIPKKPCPPPVHSNPPQPKITPPPAPIKKKPCPPSTPIHKPKPPPVHSYPPVPKITPPPPQIQKKPCPPSTPIHKPQLPPVYHHHPHPLPKIHPIHKTLPPLPKIHPIHKTLPPLPKIHPIHKTLPPLPKFPPIHKTLPPFPKIPIIPKKKLCPPIPKIPILPKLPPIPKIPHKYFHHPKFGHWPPMKPHAQNP